jgi:UDP-glucose 4-epimerase
MDVAEVLIGERKIPIEITGIRPGEKIHEIMVSEDECYRTVERGDYYAIRPMLPELHSGPMEAPARLTEYSSSEITLDHEAIARMLAPYMAAPPVKQPA